MNWPSLIKIRYCDSNELSPGLHAAAERHGRSTTVYLLSGLTIQERRAALRRLRLSARMGYCPRLPAGQLVLALLADRIRTTIGQAGAVFRLHPAGSTVPVMMISGGAIAFLVLSTVSIRVLPDPPAATRSPTSSALPVASAGAIPITGTSPSRAAGLGGGPGHGADSGRLIQPGPGRPGGSWLATPPAQTGVGGGGQGNGAGSGGGYGGGNGGSPQAGRTTPSEEANPTPTAAASQGPQGAAGTAPAVAVTTPAAATSSAAAPKPAPSASSPGSGGSGGGVCLDVGPLGICLDL